MGFAEAALIAGASIALGPVILGIVVRSWVIGWSRPRSGDAAGGVDREGTLV